MSKDTYVQVKLSNKLKRRFLAKLEDEGMTQQGFLLSRIKKFVGVKKKGK